MKIGLIDVDGHNFPNLALMKLSAWHKSQGDSVEWYQPLFSGHMDIVYMSKVFTFTEDYEYFIDADRIVKGGTGYKLYDVELPQEIENIFPDYSIYPQYDFAIGFLTRGCIRKCPWCVVPKKEGAIRAVNTWQNIKRPDSRYIRFLDNNVLACEHGREQIKKMSGRRDISIDFNQGLDARLIDDEMADYLSKCLWTKQLRMSCDQKQEMKAVTEAIEKLLKRGMHPRKIFIYLLVQDIDDALHRAEYFKSMNVEVFAQPYRDYENNSVDPQQKHLARYINCKPIFKKIKWEKYSRRIK